MFIVHRIFYGYINFSGFENVHRNASKFQMNGIKIKNVKNHLNRIYVVFKLNQVKMCKNENKMQAISSKHDIFVYEKPISVIH